LLSAVDTRASLLSAEKFLQGDRYTAVRNAYLSRREFQVNDGASAGADEFLEDF
jgi:phospholipid-binding lipoprotein MlaA